MTHPSLIVLDEATEGLAPQIVAEIWRVVETIRKDGIATLIVDRDYRKAAAHADRLVVLQKGEVVLAGPAAKLRDIAALAGYLGLGGRPPRGRPWSAWCGLAGTIRRLHRALCVSA